MVDQSRRAAVVLVLFLGLIVFVFGASTVSAAIDACRGDPILHLSSGKTMSLAVEISAPVEDVRRVKYAVHVPKGVKATSVEWLGDPALIKKEELKVYDDANPSEYTVDVYADVRGNGIKIVGTFSLDDKTKTVRGKDDEHLLATFKAK